MRLVDCPVRIVKGRDAHDLDEGTILPIVRGIPLANNRLPRGMLRRTLRRMSVGDSILIKRGTTSKAYQMAKQLGIEIAASHKGIGSQMCRVWRTK